ncbi:MAG: hypothetical protein MUC83_02050, partial [Pirellula sp.]|nr:hypothetical protein [Pirellula sp.]
RSWSLVKIGTTAAQKKLFFNLRRMKGKLAAIEDGDMHPDDVKKIISPVMAHRLILRPEARLRKITCDSVLDEIVAEIAVPTVDESRK